MKCLLVFLSIAATSAILSVAVLRGEPEPASDEASPNSPDATRENARKAGVDLPIPGKPLPDLGNLDAPQPAASPLPLTTLPEWIPSIPDFKPEPNGIKKQNDGVETGSIKGTSSASPDAIAEAWNIIALERKMTIGRADSEVSGKKSVKITLTDPNGSGGSAQLELVGDKGSTISLSYKASMTAPSPAPSKEKE